MGLAIGFLAVRDPHSQDNPPVNKTLVAGLGEWTGVVKIV